MSIAGIQGMDDIQTISNPTDQLPYETLVDIFMQCLPPEDMNISQPDPLWVPMLLCHVCARWRAVALNEHGLWRRVHFSCCYEWDTSMQERSYQEIPVPVSDVLSSAITQRNVESIRWWIENAQALPLSTIRFEFNVKFSAERFLLYSFHVSHKDAPSNVDQVNTIKRALLSARHLEINWICADVFRSHNAADDLLRLLHTLIYYNKSK